MPTNTANVTTQATLGMPLAVILVWALETFSGIKVPTEVAVAFGGLFGALFGAFMPSGE